jgi:hypothetical protein
MIKRKNQKLVLMIVAAGLSAGTLFAKEGMWQPAQLKRQESDMQKLGLKIPVEKLYNDIGTGLNNAVVLFDKGCTGEFVSGSGLIFTNHHCAYSAAQALSTESRNFLTSGFWAKNQQEEIPCPDLKVTVVRKTEDVTKYVLQGITDSTPEADRNTRIKSRIAELQKAYKNLQGLEAEVKPYYNGNQYWASVMEVYNDVRLVGFPPNGIGKFADQTDNWMWPRTSGDFAIFRVYATKDNKPAAYSATNVPYKPKVFLPINTSGYKEGDFTMVYGFPGTTQEYINSYQLNQVQYITDPIRIEAREKKLNVWGEGMKNSPDIYLKYAAKENTLANGYKKAKGEVLGLSSNDVVGKKQSQENLFQQSLANATPEDRMLLSQMQASINGIDNTLIATEYTKETVLGVELIQQSSALYKAMGFYRAHLPQDALADSLQTLKKTASGFYKNYDARTDHQVFDQLIPLYMEQGEQVVAPKMQTLMYNSGNNAKSWGNNVFANSIALNPDKLTGILDHADPADSVMIKQDPAYQIYDAVTTFQKDKLDPATKKYDDRIAPLNRAYMKHQMNAGKMLYADANKTLRLTYGQVERVDIPGSNIYQTTLEDLMPRHNAAVEEFNIPQGLRNLYNTKNYGQWAVNGTVPVNFIGSNHTSGGNSGSPVLNGKGELIGLNFDRIWQGTMSDLYYEPSVSRNVAVDIRYVLFIMEKFGNAGWLLKEMKLVK